MTEKQALAEYGRCCERFNKIAAEKRDYCSLIYAELNKKVVRREVCSGSDLFLGYYCPSPVVDLIVGNTHRGKILKRVTSRAKPTHIYGFDGDNRILTIEDKNDGTNDFYEYGDGRTVIIMYSEEKKPEIEYIVECEYDSLGRITKYTVGNFVGRRCADIEQEVYTYSGDLMESVVMWDCMRVGRSVSETIGDWANAGIFNAGRVADEVKSTGCLTTIDCYRLIHNDEGYLVGYESDKCVYEISKKKQRIV